MLRACMRGRFRVCSGKIDPDQFPLADLFVSQLLSWYRRDRADLIDQLNGLIFLARVSWRLSPGKLAHMARTLRFVGEMDQAAAHAAAHQIRRYSLEAGFP
jgi:hypothetical protein